ncbi:Integron integrase [Halomonas sp. R57-5]|nr:Integron integrase [Halomonas sp. R57-5]
MSCKRIRKLYGVEKQAKALAPEARQTLRDQKSRPLIDQLRTWLDKSLAQVLPKSALGKALHYLDHQWPRLTRFLDDGLIPLDNNPAENAIRPFVVGRKNWLFSHTPSGAQASAAIYSLIETAKANGLSPYEYLQYVFETLPTLNNDDELNTLLPWQWKETLPL